MTQLTNGLTYRCPGLLQSDDAATLESSSSSFDVAIEPVVVVWASPPAGDRAVSVLGFSNVVAWWWWWWWVLALLPLLLPLIIVAVGHDVNVFVAVNCVSVMGSIWKHFKNKLSAWPNTIKQHENHWAEIKKKERKKERTTNKQRKKSTAAKQ